MSDKAQLSQEPKVVLLGRHHAALEMRDDFCEHFGVFDCDGKMLLLDRLPIDVAELKDLIDKLNSENSDKPTIKPKNRNRNDGNRRQIIDFIADNGISDAKAVSKAIGLKPSKTRDYLKRLMEEGIFEMKGESLPPTNAPARARYTYH